MSDKEADPFMHDDVSDDDKEAISQITSKDDLSAKEWKVLYSKHPDWEIDEDDYDKILINLLGSYQEFKQKLNDMKELQSIETKEIAENDEVRREVKRKPKKIRKFFNKIYSKVTGKGKAIDDIQLDIEEFIRYVRIISNQEIELVHGGDISELKSHLNVLWDTLADEINQMEKEMDEQVS